MTQCSETGCNEKATHKYRAQSGFKVPLCDGHYKEWEKYEYKRSPVMMLIELGKWLIRLTGVLTILFGVLIHWICSVFNNTKCQTVVCHKYKFNLF